MSETIEEFVAAEAKVEAIIQSSKDEGWEWGEHTIAALRHVLHHGCDGGDTLTGEVEG